MDREAFKKKYDVLNDDPDTKRQLVREFYGEHADRSTWNELCDPYFLNKHYSEKSVSENAATQKGIDRSAGGAHDALSTLLAEKSLKRVISFVHNEILWWHLANSLDHWRYYLVPVGIKVVDTKIKKVSGGVLSATSSSQGERIFGLNPHAPLGHYGADTNTTETYFVNGATGS